MRQATADLFVEIMREALTPPPSTTLSEWADRYRVLPATAAEPGKWHTGRVPYMREIMDAISDPSVRKVVVMSAAQVAKTEGAVLNAIGYFMHYSPSPIMVMQPTLQMGESFSKERLSPMLRDTPVLRGKVDDRSRTSGNTILHKIFPGGYVTIVGANSPASLASRPIRVLLADEIDRYPAAAGNEGDPLFMAEKRTATFWDRKLVYVSTPTAKGASRIEAEYENSSREVWHVPCPACGAFVPLEWGGIVFDSAGLGEIDYACPSCGALSRESGWREKFAAGKFIAGNPGCAVRGFHLNSLASPFVPWRDVVVSFLAANGEKKKGNIELLKTWTNTEMGQTWAEEGDHLDEHELYRRRERYSCEVPAGVVCLTAGIDTQDDRFVVEVVGWGPGKESWGILYHTVYGDMKEPRVWNDLDEVLLREFVTEDGRRLRVMCACMDSGGHYSNEVYKFTKARFNRRVFAVKGGTKGDAPFIPRPTRNNRQQAYLFVLGVDTGKSLLLDRLNVLDEGPGYCHFPKGGGGADVCGYDRDYFLSLTSEHRVMTYRHGRAVFAWKIKDRRHRRNEALDCRNYAAAALEIANPELKQHEEARPPVRRAPGSRGKRSGGIEEP